MDHSLRDKIRDLLQELSGCYAFEAEDTAKSILSLIAEEVEYQRQGVGDDDWYDGWNAAIRNVLDLLGEIIVSNPPEAQAEGWQQEWECDVCGYLYKAPRPHGDNCIGTMHRIDRRKSDEDHEIENAVRDIHCKQCGTWYKEGCDHECKPTTVKSDEAGLRESFVAGAKWWEFESTGGTMWQSDQGKAYTEAIKRYPLKGEKKWKCSNGHISTKEPVDGKCLLCGLVVGQGEEKKG